ncbi:transposase [bacterium BD-1]|nr:transposase [Ottowia caeni]
MAAAADAAISQPAPPSVVDTLGGRMHVRWDEGAAATPHGQLVYFTDFLATTGLFDRWVRSCPLSYSSGNAPDKRDVLGTLLLSLLAGHRRYAHVSGLRGDAVAAQALGMNKLVSEDALRRALLRIDAAASDAWLRPSLMHSVREALDRPWILDMDASVKPLYGRQEGAEIGYNPTKPKRPSHVLHTFLVGNLRLVLDVQLSGGKQHASGHAKAALGRLLDDLQDRRAALVRGDSGYGNEGVLLTLEEREQRYLLRLRQTKNVQRLVLRQFARQDWSLPDSQGCQMAEDEIRLLGWSQTRRVVIVRQRIRGGIARERRMDHGQLRLDFADNHITQGDKLWEYTVLVTNADYPLESIGQLYRDRADAENAFDELKNQWGLGGFTTQDLTRCQTVARSCALVYNWWSWYGRAANPSRPLLLAAVGRAVTHAHQTTLYLTPIRGRVDVLKKLLANVDAALQHVKAAAEQLRQIDPWACMLRYICDRIAPKAGPPLPPMGLVGPG